jgi:hypothetical protein
MPKMPVICGILGDYGESVAFFALLHCGRGSVHVCPAVVSIRSKAAHSSSQRAFIDWQLSSSLLPIRIKSPTHPPPASGSFLFPCFRKRFPIGSGDRCLFAALP